MNNLDPEVAEDPDKLIVYGGTGRAARSWEAFDAIVRSLRELENDETLLVQSGKPVGIFRTHDEAPRVLIANSNLVGQWSNYAEFNRLERLGLTMYGQMTAGSWIYIGSQGIVQGTFETFAGRGRTAFWRLARRKICRDRRPRRNGWRATAGRDDGRRGLPRDRGRPDADRETVARAAIAIKSRSSLDEAMQLIDAARAKKEAISVGLVGNCADVLPEMVRRGIVPDVLDRSDQRARRAQWLRA